MSRVKSEMMRVWVDGQCFQSASRYRGIGRAILETLSFLKRDFPAIDLHLSLNAAHPDEAQTARNVLTPLLGAKNIHVWESLVKHPESQTRYGPSQKASEAVLTHHVRSLAPDLVWSPSLFEGGHRRFVSLLNPDLIGCPSIVTFHDAIPWRFPERYLPNKAAYDCYARHLDGLGRYDLAMAVSDFAAHEIRDIVPGQSVVTVSSGLSKGFQEIVEAVSDAPKADEISDFELLYVGGIDWRKNVPRILEALAILKSKGRDDIALTLVGDQPDGDLKQLVAQAKSLGVEDCLRFVGFCSDEDLIRAYQRCDAAIQPSIMEGFGLTALEAMRAGAPLIAARAGALPDVVGKGALLFDPYRADELADHIETLIDEPDVGDELRRLGREQCDKFDWERVSANVAKAISGMVSPVQMALSDRPEPLSSLRQQIAAQLGKNTVKAVGRERLASHLVAAEVPSRDETPRLFIDVTSTLYANHGTGIQRVVTRIAREALRHYPNAQLVICDSDVGLEAAEMTVSGQLRTTKRLTRERVFPKAGDTVLLLDSSWTWHKPIETVMTDARLRGARVISVMYDLVPVNTPAFCDDGMPDAFSKWLRAALRYSDGFICISEATAKALHGFLEGQNFPRPMSIDWWPLGADIGPADEAGSHDPHHFLSVATLEPRKGHMELIRAFERLWDDDIDVSLTLIGRPGWGTQSLQDHIRKLERSESRLQWISDADDERLSAAYAEAGTLIAASYEEGFGLPIIEARRQGCGVIARDIDVFREVAPEGTAFFQGQDELISAIKGAVSDRPLSDSVPAITDWEQSTHALVYRLDQDAARLLYVPRRWDQFTPDSETGAARMKGPVPEDSVNVALEWLPMRLDSPRPGHTRFAVEVTNQSDIVLFSKGRLTGEDCVHLSYLTYDHDGVLRDIVANRTPIPYGLGCGQSTILPIDVPDDIVENPVIRVEFALVQEGRGWWTPTARLMRDTLLKG